MKETTKKMFTESVLFYTDKDILALKSNGRWLLSQGGDLSENCFLQSSHTESRLHSAC